LSGWIKIDKHLTETIRFRRVVRKLKDSSNALRDVTKNSEAFAVTVVLGALVRFWVYADSHIRDDDSLDISLDEINEIVGVDGFAQALPAEWLQVIDAEHVQLPNFHEHNGSSEKLRRDNARRQAAYRHRHHSRNVTRDVTASNASNDARPDQTRPDKTRPEEEVPSEPVEQGSTDAVGRVFEHWRTTHGHPKAALDDKRRKKIREALKHYSEADLCQAITGYLNSPHHAGQNANGTVYDDITLLLRDSSHIDAGLRFYADPPQPKSKAHQAQSANVSAGLAFLARSSQ
jgi:hypothetical protein